MSVAEAAPRPSGRGTARPTVAIAWEDPSREQLGAQVVTYQGAQFAHLAEHADVVGWGLDLHAHARTLAEAPGPNAILTFDEYMLWQNPGIRSVEWGPETSFVWIAHDCWQRPLELIDLIRRQPNPLLVLRHLSAVDLFHRLAPDLPSVLQRPGVETAIFHPRGPKEFDVLLSGSETPDYPHRIRFNRIVRENAARCGWKLLDLTAIGMLNDWPPRANQLEYAPALAAAKVSPTATVHGGRAGATIVTQFLDHSESRAQDPRPFISLDVPDVAVRQVPTGGITPRYLESFASKTLLVGDLPDYDAQEWYRDKMVAIPEGASDEEIVELVDHWVRADDEREELCEYAYAETLRTETSAIRAAELAEIVARHIGA
jgi:hypothetical protein